MIYSEKSKNARVFRHALSPSSPTNHDNFNRNQQEPIQIGVNKSGTAQTHIMIDAQNNLHAEPANGAINGGRITPIIKPTSRPDGGIINTNNTMTIEAIAPKP